MAIQRILVHSGKHPFQPFDYGVSCERALQIFGLNSGNLLFADALFKYLYVSAGMELESDGYGFPTAAPEWSAEAINERFDCVVFPAANWLAGYYREHLARYAAKIRKLRIPVVVVGLGAQSARGDTFDFLEEVRPEAQAFLAAVAEKSPRVSVRGAFTAECLHRLGFDNAAVTGCPSIYRNLNELRVEKRPVERAEFRLAVNGNKPLLAGLRADLFDRYDSVLFSQGDILRIAKHPLSAPWRDLKRSLADGFTMDLLSQGRVRLFGDIPPWLEALKHHHFSLGARIHGNILALLAGTPAMVAVHDSRTGEMADFYRIPTVRIQRLREGVDPYELYQAADYGLLRRIYPERLAGMAAFLEENGLRHTLYETNGTTPYDQQVRRIAFDARGYVFDNAFVSLARNLSPAFSRLKTLKTRLQAAPAVQA